MYIDLLVDETETVYAVDCTLESSLLRVGALFIDAYLPTTSIRFPHNGEVIQIELPESQLNQPDAVKAWDLNLQLNDE